MTTPVKVLVVDDDTAHRTMLKTLLGGWGYAVAEADDGAPAIDLVASGPFDLILMDIRMVTVSGIEALERIKQINPSIPVIIMTAYSSVDTAVDALKKGAYDYLVKPLDFDTLRLAMSRAMEHVALKAENRRLRESLGEGLRRNRIIGTSPAMNRLLETVSQVAPTEATVLITGESGTGKELIAGAVHYNSARARGPFVKLNCAAITESLMESELFGHEKGSFTGADRRKEGRFVQASGGSLFLDEVSEMPLNMQVKLLRVLQEREVTRVGGDEVVPIDVRLIAATNRDLAEAVQSGQFREDLYYRLNVIMLPLPSLRQRREDIPLLAQHFLGQYSERNNRSIKGFTPQAMDRLNRYDWPGNVREMMNIVERAVVLARGDHIELCDLPPPLCEPPAAPEAAIPDAGTASLEEVEKATILQTLNMVDGNKSEAARRLGVTRKTLHAKLKKYGV